MSGAKHTFEMLAGLGAGQALPMAGDLARRAVRLQAVMPQLRAKGARRARRDRPGVGAAVGDNGARGCD